MMNKLVSPTGKPIILRPIRSNARIEAIYRKRLLKLVQEMNDSILYWLSSSYKQFDNEIAQDANPFKKLQQMMKELSKRWLSNLKVGAQKLAEWHTSQTLNMTDQQLKQSLKEAGFTVPFKMTQSMQTVFDAHVSEQVNLITNMTVNNLAQIETLVTNSVQTGRDLATLTDELKTRFGMTERRAKLIARDQNNKATQLITRQRQQDLGITQAVWKHSHAGKVPRPSHVKADGKIYDLDKGMFLDNKWTFPSVEINCFPAESVIEFAGGCKKLFRRSYTGVLSQIVTKNGNILKATPNHPILTQRGWVAIKDINVGDYVAKISSQILDSMKIDINSNKTTFAELFNSTSNYISPTAFVDSTVFKFHGDISNTKVDIIDIDCFLPDIVDSRFCKKFCEIFFPMANMVLIGAGFSSDCALKTSASRLFFAPESVIGGFSTLLPFLKSHSSEANDICLRLSAYLNAAFYEASSDCTSADIMEFRKLKLANPSIVLGCNQFIGELFNLLTRGYGAWNNQTPSADVLGNNIGVCFDDFTSIGKGHSFCEYEFDSVIDTSVCNFSDHVYNLENNVNWYSTDSIISHNCRCFSRPIISGFID